MPSDPSVPADFRPYFSGVFAPVREEAAATDLPVIGELPRDLNGLFVQNGPNPRFVPNTGHSWFDGDGMVHAIELTEGRVSFRSRWIETQGLAEDLEAGRATYVGSMAKPGAGKRHKNIANTDIVHHAGRLLALWWEGDAAHELGLPDLGTLGRFEYGGALPGGITSHAKLDPATGELFFFSWGRKAPFLHVGAASSEGRITFHRPVELPGPRIQHDMAISERFICVFDFPLRIALDNPGSSNLGFRFDAREPARIGLIERKDEAAAVRWFDIAPCFMWHLSSAWDEGEEFVLIGARIEHPTRIDSAGVVRDSGPMIDGEHRFDARPWEWRINVATGAVRERQLDESCVEFPRVNDAVICSGARYSYMLELDGDGPTVMGRALLKYDLQNGTRERLAFPAGHVGYEATFAPREGASEEDDGFLVGFVTSEKDLTSEFWVTPSRALEDGPVVRVRLPHRVPSKFHGRWIPASAYR